MADIRTQNDVLGFLEGRLAYLRGIHILDKLPKDRSEQTKLEVVLGPATGRRKALDLWKFFKDNYAGKDVYVPANYLLAA